MGCGSTSFIRLGSSPAWETLIIACVTKGSANSPHYREGRKPSGRGKQWSEQSYLRQCFDLKPHAHVVKLQPAKSKHTHTHTLSQGTHRPAERMSSNRTSHHISSLSPFLYVFVYISMVLAVWTTKITSYNRTTIYAGDLAYCLRISLGEWHRRAKICGSELA
jgi:hypothetical protein